MKNRICPACSHKNPATAFSCANCQYPFDRNIGAKETRVSDLSEYKVEVGDVIDGRYKVVRLLGRGGMGEVYLVLDLLMDNEECALKLIHHALMRSPEARQRFRSEVSISRRLHHPAIVKVYDIGHWKDQEEYYFTMEYLAGQTLAALLAARQGKVPPSPLAEIRQIIPPLLECLAYAHTQTIHRDIKPDNIMVKGEGPDLEIKILDFGIARAMSASRFTQTAQGLGTPYYMAPEQMEDAHHIDHRADLYGVGVILYELLTGKRAMGLFKLPSALVGAGYSPFDDVVATALAPEPEDRYADAGAMNARVKQSLDQAEKNLTEIVPETKKEPAPKSGQKQKRQKKQKKKPPSRPDKNSPFSLPLVALAAVALIIVGATLFVLRNREKPPENKGTDPVAEQLARCEQYGNNNAWKEAESCYTTLLRENPDEQQAKEGLTSVHEQVATRGLQAVQNGEIQSARTYLALLKSFPGVDQEMNKLNKALVTLEARQEKENRQKEIAGQLTRCDQLLGREQYRKAHACYTDVLQRDSGNSQAASGLSRIENTVVSLGRKSVSRGDIQAAREQLALLTSLGMGKEGINTLKKLIGDYEQQQTERQREQERNKKIAALRDRMSEAEAREDWPELEQLGNQLLSLIPADSEGKKMVALARDRQKQDAKEQERKNKIASLRDRMSAAKAQESWPELEQLALRLLKIQEGDNQALEELSLSRRMQEEAKKQRLARLTIEPEPADAKIRILNIVPPYEPGMELEPGRYHIEVSAPGYTKKTGWVELAAGREQSFSFVLEKQKTEIGHLDQTIVDETVVGHPAQYHPSTYTDPTTGMEFVYVEGGCFDMGDTFGDGGTNEEPVHEVCVDGFYMGRYEVTQDEWKKVMGNNPSEIKGGWFMNHDNYPVETVSWNDTQKYIRKLNSMSSKKYRLPTEAEWEYAARERGRKVRFGTGKDIIGPDEANFDARKKYKKTYSRVGIFREHTTSVGSFAPNGLGLYDMSGNVWEWCRDWYDVDYYTTSPRHNPRGPASGSYRVFRGGGWDRTPGDVRAAYRFGGWPAYRGSVLGFRLAFTSGPVE